jgi:hypothetical protein
MDDRDYQQALQREAAWLDEQLALYVAQPKAASFIADGKAHAADLQQAVGSADEVEQNRPGLRFEDKLQSTSGTWANDSAGNGHGQAQSVLAPVELGVAQPPQPSQWRQKLSGISGWQAATLFLLLITVGFAVWQAAQARSYKKQAEQAELNVASWGDAQSALDDALCAAGYPAVRRAITEKAAAQSDLTDSEKALLAFGEYRTAVPNVAEIQYRVDTEPPCTDTDNVETSGADGEGVVTNVPVGAQ